MSDLEQRVVHLEETIEKLELDAHASRVAIAVLSTALSAVAKEELFLGDAYLTGLAQAGAIELDAPEGYQEKLNKKVAALLGTQK